MIFFYIVGGIFLTFALYHFILWFFKREDFSLIGFGIYNVGIAFLDIVRDIYPVYNNDRLIYDSGSCIGVLLMSLGLIIFTYVGFDLKGRVEFKFVIGVYIILLFSFIITFIIRVFLKIDYMNPIFYTITVILCILYFILLVIRFIKSKLYKNIDNLIIIIGTTFLIVIATFYSIISIVNKRYSPYFFYISMLIGSCIYLISIVLKFNREHKELLRLRNKGSMFINDQSLSNEEKEIIKLILEGKTNKEIGSILNIKSEGTVKSKVLKIFKKYNVSNRIELLNRLLKF